MRHAAPWLALLVLPLSCSDPVSEARGFARDVISCTTSADCCAVQDGCMAQMYLVSAADRAHVEQLLASATDRACLACITPPVQVDCRQGRCIEVRVEPGDGGVPDLPEAARSHCGAITLPAGWHEVPSTGNKTIIGCGT